MIEMKKWFMLQMWRMQQVATMLTLGMLAINLALQLYTYVGWREGVFKTPYYGIPIFLFIIIVIVWSISIFWDLKMKMWRDQMAVTVERNPYAKEKLVSKEVVMMCRFWIPQLEKSGNHADADYFRNWIKKELSTDPSLREELKDLLAHIGFCAELDFLLAANEEDAK
jgi:hypothetical protein